MKTLCLIAVFFLCACGLRAQTKEVIPPAPTRHFNDYAGAISPPVAAQLDQTLDQFERQTSDQIVVAIFPKLQTASPMEDFTVKVLRAWKPGLAHTNNGAILFVFVQDHKMRIETGYGLEGTLPDALCKDIIDTQIAPHFRQNDYNAGMTAGVNAMLAAARGEYRFHGNGRTVAENTGLLTSLNSGQTGLLIFAFVFVLVFITIAAKASSQNSRGRYRRGRWYDSGGWGGGWGSGGGWSGGGGGGFSGGGFSGGGGSGGGGGASGSW